MKKILLSAAAMLAIAPVFARTLSPDEALARVNASSDKARAAATVTPRLIATGEYQGLTTYYVFSGDKSAMILGADDLTAPVLGYLDHAVTETTPMPDQLKWWLEQYGRELKYANDRRNTAGGLSLTQNGKLTFNNTMRKKTAAKPKTATYDAIAPMMQTKWDQGSPYNLSLPSGVATGCVATAMAQVMKYHNYPEKGTGTVSTTYNGSTLSLNLDNTTFEWDKMTNTYNSASTYAAKNAVATLMKACGLSVKMEYGESSGAMTQDIPGALTNNFKYDLAIDYQMRDFYDYDTWVKMLYDDLKANGPILYGGVGTDGGHQFVFDGYQDDKFHVNWGWSGSYDGYFALTALVPDGQGVGGNSDGFNYEQDAIFGVAKPKTGSTRPDPWMCVYGGTLTGSISSRSLTLFVDGDGDGQSGGQYDGMFINGSAYNGNFSIGIALTNTSDNTTTYYSYGNYSLPCLYGISTIQCTIPTSLADGTYRAYPVYRLNSNADWLPIRINVTSTQYIPLEISSGNITIVEEGPEENFSFAFPNGKPTFQAGKPYEQLVRITNEGSEKMVTKLAGIVHTLDASQDLGTYDYIDVVLEAGETKDFIFTGTVRSGITSGTYAFGIANDEWWLGRWYADITGDYDIGEWAVDGDIVEKGTFKSTFKVINNSSSIISKKITALFCVEEEDNKNSLDVVDVAGTKSVVVPKNTTKSFSMDCSVPETVKAGEYYLAFCYETTDSYELIDYIFVTVKEDGGVNDITVDENLGEAQYFDLQGRPVDKDNLNAGVYVRRTGNKATKVIVK